MVSITEITKSAVVALRKNFGRSILTIVGIVIGVGAITFVMSVGQGVESLIVGELGAFGTETVVIRPGKEPKGLSDFADFLFTDSLTEKDIPALLNKNNVPNLSSLSPEVIVSGSVSWQRETHSPIILGISAEFIQSALGISLEEGENFTEYDIRARTSKALIGSKVKEELFGENDAIGETITIKNKKFEVVGVYAPRGQVAIINVDDLVVVPYSTAQSYLLGQSHYTQIITKADDPENVDIMSEDIRRTLRETHGLRFSDEDDFNLQTQQGGVEQVSSVLGLFTTFLVLTVAISLVVGGVVVMNIMLVSVTERTREIGLRKALGATGKDILAQFLIESIILTVFGGVIGIILGSLFSFVVSFILNQADILRLPFVFPVVGAVVGFFMSVFTGLVFGLYPASNASKKSPIEALRHE